jgi:4-methylaminobutanoate oxidase (formaldehyde-forming)
VYSTYYDIHYPNEERAAGRPLRRSPAYPRLVELGCELGEKSGWERPNWFRPNAAHGDETTRPRGSAGEHWNAAIGAEALACRDHVVIFDETSFSKMDVAGPGAAGFLDRVCANEVDREIGTVTYTQLCNESGGVECDLTVTRLSNERFLLVTGTAFGSHDLGWISKQLELMAPSDVVHARDVTSAWACYGIWGPRARDVVGALTDAELGNDAFPYMTARSISIGAVPVVAVRVTYVGELGWELYCPTEYGLTLWDTIWDAGGAHGMVAGGYRAIDALRLEKGYRVWGADVTPDDNPFEAGLGFAVRLDKAVPFLGRDALRTAKAAGITRRLRAIVLGDPRSVALGSEPVRIDGEIVGRVTSGGYGFRIGRSIAYAYVPADRSDPGRMVEVEVFGEWVPGEIVRDPLYDPAGVTIRA